MTIEAASVETVREALNEALVKIEEGIAKRCMVIFSYINFDGEVETKRVTFRFPVYEWDELIDQLTDDLHEEKERLKSGASKKK